MLYLSLSKTLIASRPVPDDTDSAGLEGVMPLTPVSSVGELLDVVRGERETIDVRHAVRITDEVQRPVRPATIAG